VRRPREFRWRRLGAGLVAALAVAACETRAVPPPTHRVVRSVPAVSGPFGHVFIIVEENANYTDVIGDSAMPYLNSLARRYGLATQFYANAHPSIGNYFMMTVGDTITDDDGYSGIVSADNVVRRLVAAGKTWTSYAEDLPSVGYMGAGRGRYARKHNVLALLSDVAGDTAQQRNLLPFSQFATDLARDALPDYAFIVPNLCNDAHDCPLSTADAWLKTNIDPLVRSATFQRDGLLIIVFDESGRDNTHGGGRIPCVIVSPKAKRAYRSTTLYQQQSLLRLSLKALGVKAFPNAAARAPDMDEFFASKLRRASRATRPMSGGGSGERRRVRR
jgi:hypothetical protein